LRLHFSIKMQMMQVAVPAGVKSGDQFAVQTPSGAMQVTCPEGVAEGGMMQVQVPAPVISGTAVAQPVAFGQGMANAGPPGNSFLLGVKGLYVRQYIEIMEVMTGCETKNKYGISAIPLGTTIPGVGRQAPYDSAPTSSWSKDFRSSADFNPLLKGKEESECMERICCPLFRSFAMPFKDGNGTDFITLHRPFHCDPCYNPPCMTCATQEMSIASAGTTVGSAKEITGACCSKGCCERQFQTYNAAGEELYTLKINDCTSKSGGSNCLAPTCCNEALTVDVTDSKGELLPACHFVFPGCNCGGLQDMTNMIIEFPDSASADERSSLVVGMFLIEFTVMELRRQNNNNGGGGGGGAPPTHKEMER